ncbi:DUF4157 domain-containing protein [Nostoc sp. FACHB-280]|uniref:eCIS core domain-containing protein n=1 Tax=Nostoc sp. FACHB-280 TaxID=2692839 RepID=UPI00168AEDD4|nr:DUF4157 domain-containing protein [Nostoc sp. FACHB-280]MBD2496794.1 DUF4157 domain-containing protein [Nostoc sp. FACHB-280]
MRTHQASQKKFSAQNNFAPTANPLESRPFAAQRKPEEITQPQETQEYKSQIPEFSIFNPEGERQPVQPKLAIQRREEQSETLQAKPENTSLQRQEESKTPNQTGLPNNLKAGVENLSGYSLDNVRVHYNSPKPAQLQALAYAQGTEIHIAPGQEEHLPHETWHVVQQMQGRVKPTMQMKGVQINDDQGLETEADMMGARTLDIGNREMLRPQELSMVSPIFPSSPPLQLMKYIQNRVTGHIRKEDNDEYIPTWSEKAVSETEYRKYINSLNVEPKEEKKEDVPSVYNEKATATKILTTVSTPTEKKKPVGQTGRSAVTDTPRKYPRGFESEEQFRDLTRPLAKAHRESTIIVSGSSVTGKSYLTGKPFSKKSDIDIGIVGRDEFKSGEIDERGFASKGVRREEELAHKARIEEAIGHKSGLKFFRKPPKREYLVRDHTPEASDEED